eukprot:Hpha_TRINITY_DN11009_c0_g1::TRINITY_DN11009_c0_g1_i2::g.92630::m.92630
MSLSRSFFLLCLLSSCRARWTKIEEDNNLAVKENNNWGKIRDTNVADDGYTRRLGKIRAPEVSSVAVSGSKIRGDCVALSSITALTFEEGGVARRSRTPPVVSMSCVGNCEGGPRVTAAQCKRQGVDDGGSPQWECRGRFSPAIPPWGFGRVRVQCEGCTRPGDAYVTRGSCALQYSLRRLSKPGPVHSLAQPRGRPYNSHQGRYTSYSTTDYASESASSTAFWNLFLLLCCFFGVCLPMARYLTATPPGGRLWGRPSGPPISYAYGRGPGGDGW